jgi:hypothetical protein
LARPRRIARNGGTKVTASMSAWRSGLRSSRPLSQAPMPSMRRRTWTPSRAFARSASAISSPSPSRASRNVQTSSVSRAPAMTASAARRASVPSAWICSDSYGAAGSSPIDRPRRRAHSDAASSSPGAEAATGGSCGASRMRSFRLPKSR